MTASSEPMGHETTTSLLAETIYWDSPEIMVIALGWWEVAIGITILYKPLIRVALFFAAMAIGGTIRPERI